MGAGVGKLKQIMESLEEILEAGPRGKHGEGEQGCKNDRSSQFES